jgi:hypothetical protein
MSSAYPLVSFSPYGKGAEPALIAKFYCVANWDWREVGMS